ncbi:MAG: hypothetical protein WC002_06920 [Candidatus Muiribacteriota bacterium]
MNLTEHLLEHWHYYERIIKAICKKNTDEKMSEILLNMKIYNFKTYSETECRNFILNYIN